MAFLWRPASLKQRQLLRLGVALLFFTALSASVILFGSAEWSFRDSTVWIGGKAYEVERAESMYARFQGLGGRESLCGSCVMLFVFPEPGLHAFWMKDMRFPLDIVWLSDEKIVHIERHVSPHFTEVLRPSQAADQVLELNAGEADVWQTGDSVRFSP